MARVNHKLVKQRLNEKRSKITDRQFFSSRLLAGYFEDLAAAQTRRAGSGPAELGGIAVVPGSVWVTDAWLVS